MICPHCKGDPISSFGLPCGYCGGEGSVFRPATTEELAVYAERSRRYHMLAADLEMTLDLESDPQVRAMAGTFALECRELAKRWANETEGGL